jgi:hypothetical protein
MGGVQHFRAEASGPVALLSPVVEPVARFLATAYPSLVKARVKGV